MADSNVFENNARGLAGNLISAVRAISVTPNDSTDLDPTPTRALTVNADGNISVIFADDSSAVTITVVAGVVYPFSVKRVRSTSTTATGIVAYY